MTDDEKDEVDLLCEATEFCTAIWDAKLEMNHDLQRARRAIRKLIQKGWISLWWYKSWAGSDKPEELIGQEFDRAVKDLEQDNWWDPGEDTSAGYYAFGATEAGLVYFQSNPDVAEYMRNEWKSRAMERGIIFFDGSGKLDTSS